MSSTPLDFSKIAVHSLDRHEPDTGLEQFIRPCAENSSIRDFRKGLADCGSGREFNSLVRKLADIKRGGRQLILGVGSTILEDGQGPLIIDLLERSIISALCLTGAAVFRDVEISCCGGFCESSLDNQSAVPCTREMAEVVNHGINYGDDQRLGFGEAVGDYLRSRDDKLIKLSILAAASHLGIPLTVHPTIGAETAHFLPSASAAAIGRTAHRDFRIFAGQVANLQGGIFITSEPFILPKVFTQAVQAARSLDHRVDDFTAGFLGGTNRRSNQWFEWQASIGCVGASLFAIDGPYGLVYPLVAACLLDELSETC